MARARRDTAAGIFHVTGHSVWASQLFRDDIDRLAYLRELPRVIAAFEWSCLGYCLMTSHVHLLFEVPADTLAEGMQQLHTRYACQFNQRYELRGHVFGGRYGANRIDTDAHLLSAFAYVMRNPVEAGLCSRPEEWAWSSYAATIGLAPAPSFVDTQRILSLLGAERGSALRRLREYVERS